MPVAEPKDLDEGQGPSQRRARDCGRPVHFVTTAYEESELESACRGGQTLRGGTI
jgi:hypothetical protein